MIEAEEPEERGGHESSERWLISYADFITLLFALFVLLYAVSMASEADRNKVWHAVVTALGHRPYMGGGRPDMGASIKGDQPPAEELADQALAVARRAIEHSLQAHENSGVTVKLDESGLTISLAAARFFESGSAEINPSQKPVLNAVVAAISKLKNPILVEGFTDSIPIHNEHFEDNWDLSAARAAHVLRYILEQSKLPPEQLSLAGYGPYHPIASNDTEEGRALNRRVDIFIPRMSLVAKTRQPPLSH